MAGEKIFIGPKLRMLRRQRDLTQAELAKLLGVSTSYVNLIEHNQRSASVKFLISLSENLGLDWRDLTPSGHEVLISDLRKISDDPAFGGQSPDVEELRTAIDGSPNLVNGLINIYNAYRTFGDRLAEHNEVMAGTASSRMSIEQGVHDFFRNNNNYFPDLEASAGQCGIDDIPDRQEIYSALRAHLRDRLSVDVKRVNNEILGATLCQYDAASKTVVLSDALDHTNQVFQLAHMIGVLGFSNVLTEQLPDNLRSNEEASKRSLTELANYFAAAMLMPYESFRTEAQRSKHDIDLLATRFAVSYEQVCHRLTTMQRPGKRGIPFFFLRIDRGGNVSKRFNVTPMELARYGGACPKLDVHYCFRIPGRILTQIVEMPDHSRYLTVNRTVDRPAVRYSTEDKRLAVSIGCSVEHAKDTVYGSDVDLNAPSAITKVGVNCRLCPRQDCAQRAHDPFYSDLKLASKN